MSSVSLKNSILVQSQLGSQKLGFIARLILEGDGYGAWSDGEWALTHKGDPLIEFFDVRYQHTPYGQFTGGRYLLSTFMEREDDRGLLLDGGIPSWSLTVEAVRAVQNWASTEYPELLPKNYQKQVAVMLGSVGGGFTFFKAVPERDIKSARREFQVDPSNLCFNRIFDTVAIQSPAELDADFVPSQGNDYVALGSGLTTGIDLYGPFPDRETAEFFGENAVRREHGSDWEHWIPVEGGPVDVPDAVFRDLPRG